MSDNDPSLKCVALRVQNNEKVAIVSGQLAGFGWYVASGTIDGDNAMRHSDSCEAVRQRFEVVRVAAPCSSSCCAVWFELLRRVFE